MYARLDAAIVTQGVVLAESQRKTVEHLEGGILERLAVRAGDRVREGQVVATLDATQTREALTQFEAELTALAFETWRLRAEETGADRLDAGELPDAARRMDAPERARRIAAQTRLFEARRRAHLSQVEALERQIEQLGARASADAAQSASAARQIALWARNAS